MEDCGDRLKYLQNVGILLGDFIPLCYVSSIKAEFVHTDVLFHANRNNL